MPAFAGETAPNLLIPCCGSRVHRQPEQSISGLNADLPPAPEVRASAARTAFSSGPPLPSEPDAQTTAPTDRQANGSAACSGRERCISVPDVSGLTLASALPSGGALDDSQETPPSSSSAWQCSRSGCRKLDVARNANRVHACDVTKRFRGDGEVSVRDEHEGFTREGAVTLAADTAVDVAARRRAVP